MQVSAVPHSEVLAVQGQNSQTGNIQDSNQVQDVNAPSLNWKTNFTCCKCGDQEHLICEYLHTGSSAIVQREWTPIINTQQASYTGPTLFSATNPTLSKAITAEIPITTEVWKTPMEQFTKVNEDNELLKKAYKKKAQQNHVYVARATQQNQALATKCMTN